MQNKTENKVNNTPSIEKVDYEFNNDPKLCTCDYCKEIVKHMNQRRQQQGGLPSFFMSFYKFF